MKKLVVTLFLLTSYAMFAQSSEEETKKKVTTDYYFGIGAQVQNKYDLNDKLKLANLPELKEFIPELQLGVNIFGEKFSGDVEFGFLFSKEDKGDNKIQDLAFSARLKVHYNFINKEKVAFTGGLNIASTGSQVDLYSKGNSIDLNNLEPDSNSGHVSLRNNVFYVGPSAALYLFKDKSTRVRLNLGYEFALTNGKWKSDFASVNNTVKEIGNNRFIFGISLL